MATNTLPERPWQEPKQPIVRGAFIVMEGLDRAGKTTQVEKLANALYESGRNVETMRFPDRTSPIGMMISNYLQSKSEMDDHVVHLLFSANRWEKVKHINDTLAKGCTIICDRYYYSGMVYSAAKRNPNLSIDWARAPEVGLPRPDMVVFLNLSTEEAAKRGGFGDEKYETSEMQKNVRENFVALKDIPADEGQDLQVIDAGGSVEEVGKAIWSQVVPRVEEVEQGDFSESSTGNDTAERRKFGKEVRKVQPWNDSWEEMTTGIVN
ncbi:thymidylate kinase [Coleophoma cylindrospora]|uniref:Thymidylate kinase n=1 Tax=Coleophoma cylindrospora TaxID=1849047 RepID=A0A3D8SQ74_9HELO|nr:thymidylate kinase [Coleophoma cylindrospora]